MSIKDMMLKFGGKYLFVLQDKSKWVIDLDKMIFDSFEWYDKVGTLESDLSMEILDEFFKKSKVVKRCGL